MSTPLARGISKRRFGVELEFSFRGVSWEDDRGRPKARRILDELGLARRWTNIGFDGSGLEVRTPILQGISGMRELRSVMEAFAANGGRCTNADGMHVHHDAPEFRRDKQLLELAIESWHINLPMIHKFVARRRHNSGACPKFGAPMVEYSKRDNFNYRGHPRYDFNFAALAEHGSIELRLHEGTMDFREAQAWILFGQRFLDYHVRNKELLTATRTIPEFLRKLAVPESQQRELRKKARSVRVRVR